MVKAKYKFNPETLSYIKVEHNFKARLSRLLILFSVSLVMSVIMVMVFLQFYETPENQIAETGKPAIGNSI